LKPRLPRCATCSTISSWPHSSLTRAEAEAELRDYVQRNWDAEIGTERPTAPEEAVAEYFSEVLEKYDIAEAVRAAAEHSVAAPRLLKG
jgi:hypothetical protein